MASTHCVLSRSHTIAVLANLLLLLTSFLLLLIEFCGLQWLITAIAVAPGYVCTLDSVGAADWL